MGGRETGVRLLGYSVTAETWERINRTRLGTAHSEGVEDARQVRADSTATETDRPCGGRRTAGCGGGAGGEVGGRIWTRHWRRRRWWSRRSGAFGGEMVLASEKIVSPVRAARGHRGEVRRCTEYGRKVNLTTGRGGLMLDGNPADSSRAAADSGAARAAVPRRARRRSAAATLESVS